MVQYNTGMYGGVRLPR